MARTISQTINLQAVPEAVSKYITRIDGGGIKIHDSQRQNLDYLQLTSNGIDIKQNNVSVASFGTETVIKTTNGTELAHFGYAEGTGESEMIVAPYYTLGVRKKTTTMYDSTATYSIGDICVYNQRIYVCNTDITSPESWTSSHWTFYIGSHSYAEGYNTIASGLASHAEGYETVALDSFSHAEGHSTSALDSYSHAEGYKTIASGMVSHAEGRSVTASGYSSHAEGYDTTASGGVSHAEGQETVASGLASHAQNIGTIASKSAQTAIGIYNIEDTETTAINQKLFIIGNGSADDDRSNAFTVDWRGRIECGDRNGVLKSIFDIFYPIGSYYETSDLSFDPNTAWGGTWVLDSKGRVTVSRDETIADFNTVGKTGGEKTHTLTVDEMPSHTHKDGTSASVAYVGHAGTNTAQVAFDANSGRATTATGGGQAHNNMPPYVVVNRWHRTA